MARTRWQLLSVLFLSLAGCAASSPGSANGGKATGGVLAAGAGGAGVTAAGGTTEAVAETGGSTWMGGSTTTSGQVGSGGAMAIGGSVGTGGVHARGGVDATGGVNATGGVHGTGGIPASGGRPGTGGTATGGTNATGGVSTGGQNDTSGRATGGSATGGSSATGGATSLTAAQAAAAMGKGVNIGQTFETTQNERSLAAVSAKIDAYYAKGFRNVRIPITWTEPVGGDLLVGSATVGDVNRSSTRLAVIKQVVDYALGKSGLYVVINAHHETGLKTNSRAAVLERLWADIADIFAARTCARWSSWPTPRSEPWIPSAS